MTLAALLPATLVSPSDSIPAKIADVGIAAVVPFHAHVGMSIGTLRSVERSGFSYIPSFRRFFHLKPHRSHFIFSVVIADYVPKMMQVPARIGLLGVTGTMFLGLMKLSIMGPGIGGELKISNFVVVWLLIFNSIEQQ